MARASGKLIEFDAPNAATVVSPACQPTCGTQPLANNNQGVIVGGYSDANVVEHGFLRTKHGAITSFDAPGAGSGQGTDQGTIAFSISDSGLIAGALADSNNVLHGFVRYRDGKFTEFDAPGAGTGSFQGTYAFDINNQGDTAGIYRDSANEFHGFVRSRSGVITPFDPSGSVFTYTCEETCLNNQGVAAGFFSTVSTSSGFIRQPNGQITVVDAPGDQSQGGSGIGSINNAGWATGCYGTSVVCFLRSAGGAFTFFSVPGATQFTTAFSINGAKAVTGEWGDSSGINQGYERFSNDTYEIFNAPGAAGTGPMQGTRPSTNNAAGEVTGWWADQTGLVHGFVWSPNGSRE